MDKRQGLYDIENKIKSLIAEDVTNPEVYNQIYKLALVYLKRFKKMTWGSEAEEVATLIAEDLYMKVYNGKQINMWTAYIARSCIGYIREYRRMTGTEFIDTTGDPALEDAVVTMSISGSYSLSSNRDYQEIENIESLSTLADVIVGVMDHSRYRRYTKEYCNSHISILASILLGHRSEFKLDDIESRYFGIILMSATDKIKKAIVNISQDYSMFSGGSMMSMFSLAQIERDTSDE